MSSLGSVKVHSFTLSYAPMSMKCDSRASFLAHTFISPYLGRKLKTRVATCHLNNIKRKTKTQRCKWTQPSCKFKVQFPNKINMNKCKEFRKLEFKKLKKKLKWKHKNKNKMFKNQIYISLQFCCYWGFNVIDCTWVANKNIA